MRCLFHILFLLLLPFGLSAQKIKWEATTFNFGTVGDWNNPPATFKFTNIGNERLMFLPQRHDREVLVRYPDRAIQPGEAAEITILYYTGETGPFARTVELYTNGSSKPEKLTVKGNIRSIYANALTACPSFQERAPARNSDPNAIQVIDAATDRTIANATVEVFDRGIRKAINGTNLDGVAVNWIEPGKYIAVASKQGYEKVEQEIVFTKRDRTQVIYLNRKDSDVVLNEDEMSVAASNRWQEPEAIRPRRSKTIPDDYVEPVQEEMDLGITTNDEWEEGSSELPGETDLGVTTNEVLAEEPTKPQPEAVEEFDLGISSNEQWEEGIITLDETEEPVERIELSVNNSGSEEQSEVYAPDESPLMSVSDREAVPKEEDVSEIEQQVEAALAEALPTEEEVQLESEPGSEFSPKEYRPNNVLLLLDVSGSMRENDNMGKLRSSVRRLVLMLREVDVLTIVAYNSTSWEVLAPTPVSDHEAILALVDSLQPYGYTNGVKGMETAYQSLEKQLIPGGNNQLIVATDGKFNSSNFTEKDAVQMVKNNSNKGVVLSIIGFGEDRAAGRLMKKLAKVGAGTFLDVKDNEDPTDLLAEEIKNRSRISVETH